MDKSSGDRAHWGALSLEWTEHPVARSAAAPDLNGPDPLADPVWAAARPLPPLLDHGRPEPRQCATHLRLLEHDGWLYISGRCLEPQPAAIRAGKDPDDLHADDAVELVLTKAEQEAFPYLHIQVNAAGLAALTRYLRPDEMQRASTPEDPRARRSPTAAIGAARLDSSRTILDPGCLGVCAGMDSAGWWFAAAVPLAELGITGQRWRGNVVRQRATGDRYSWIERWGDGIHNDARFGEMRLVDRPPPARPGVVLPMQLVVGGNKLRLVDWQPGHRLLVNGRPATVEAEPGGGYVSPVEVPRHGPVVIDLVHVRATGGSDVSGGRPGLGPAGDTSLARYGAEVPHPDAWPQAAPVIGTYESLVPEAAQAVNRFRPENAALPMRSMLRAALADACNYFRLLQGQDGRYHHVTRRGKRISVEWDQAILYGFALLYVSNWPENPYHGDARFLQSAAAALEAVFAPQHWHRTLRHPDSRNLQAYLLAYEILKDHVPPEQSAYWRERLLSLVDAEHRLWARPAGYTLSCFSDDLGTGTNHWAFHMSNIHTAGRVLDRPDWTELGSRTMRRLARHERDGCFAERRGVPVISYNRLTMNALGQYYVQSGDETVRETLLRGIAYTIATSAPDGRAMIVHDGRVNHTAALCFGDFVLSMTPQGRHLARARLAWRISGEARPSQNSPEFWFRMAENALHFDPGPEAAIPENSEYSFFDGRALSARRGGFTYALSALCLEPTQRRYWVDPQNALEVDHARIGRILSGANSQSQPEAGSFCRRVGERIIYLPREGHIERTAAGHMAYLVFENFRTRLGCRVLSPQRLRVVVELLEAEGDDPVWFNFFPVAGGAERLPPGQSRQLHLEQLTITASRPVTVEQGLRIIDPYNLKYIVEDKPARAFAALRRFDPLVLDLVLNGEREKMANDE